MAVIFFPNEPFCSGDIPLLLDRYIISNSGVDSMQWIKKTWNQLSNVGVTDDLSSGEAKRIRLSNRVGVIVGLFILPYALQYQEMGLQLAVVVQLISASILMSTPLINRTHRYILARFLLLGAGLFNIFLTSSILGFESGEHTAMILGILMAFTLFDLKEQRIWLWVAIGMVFGSWFLLEGTGHEAFGEFAMDTSAHRLNYAINFSVTLFFSGLIAFYFQGLSNRQVDDIIFRAQRELRAVFDNSFDAIFLLKPGNHEIIECNLRSTEMFGVSNKSDLVGTLISDLQLASEEQMSKDQLEARLLAGERWSEEIEFKTSGGDTFWGNVAYTFIKYGEKNELLIRITDVTEKKAAIAAIIEAKEKAEAANRAKDNFLANMSHEFRTPINGIIGLAEIIGVEAEDEDLQSYADLVLESGKRLLRTLGSVLDLSRLESQDNEVIFKPVSINQMIRKATEGLEEELERKNLYFHCTLLETDVYANMSEEYGVQCLQHLLNNANKFTDKGGLTLWIEGLQATSGSPYVSIHLADTGIGMSESFIMEKLFMKFEQESDGLDRNFEGSGLGLSIVKRAVELMNGKIDVQSTKGEGSTFTLSFPVMLPEPAA